MTLASGTRRGSALSTPSTSVQMWISSASSSAPKIEPEKSLPLRPSVVCRPFGIARDEAGDDQRRRHRAAAMRVRVGLRDVPAHRRAERSPLDRHDVARVDPVHLAGPAAAMAQVGAEQARRPDLAVAGDQVAHGLRSRADQLRRSAGCRRCRGSPARASRGIRCARSPVEQRVGDHLVAVAQLLDAVGERRFLALGGGDQIQQRIGDAAAGRQHDAEARMRILLEDPGHALHAYRIGDARAAELMYAPPLHLLSISCCSAASARDPPRNPRARVAVAHDAQPCGSGRIADTRGNARTLGGRHSTGRPRTAGKPAAAASSRVRLSDRRVEPAEGEQRARPRPRRPRAGNPGRAKQIVSPGSGCGRGCGVLVEIHHPGRSDLDQIAMPQRAAQDAARVHQQAVGAAEIEQQVLAVVAHDQRVVAADEHRIDAHIGFLAAPDQDAIRLRARPRDRAGPAW